MDSKIMFTSEELDYIKENINKMISAVNELVHEIVKFVKAVAEKVAQFLKTKISVRSKKEKKGKKYIYKYEKIQLWKYLLQIRK